MVVPYILRALGDTVMQWYSEYSEDDYQDVISFLGQRMETNVEKWSPE